MKKRIIIIGAALAVFAGIAVGAYAAYVLGGSGASGFTAGNAADLTVAPQGSDLDGILPGQTLPMDVLITNSNAVPVSVTGLTATFNDGGDCDFTVTPVNPYSYTLGAGASFWDQLSVYMGDPDPGCEGWVGTVTATATGTMP
ncbi:MAG: hypothetical protein Q8Q00_04305 [Dehalococcoidia bacterium]|nr:hypothetical protein [Dehalococcoidia bacterium]